MRSEKGLTELITGTLIVNQRETPMQIAKVIIGILREEGNLSLPSIETEAHKAERFDKLVAKIEEIQDDENKSLDDIGPAVLDELDMWP